MFEVKRKLGQRCHLDVLGRGGSEDLLWIDLVYEETTLHTVFVCISSLCCAEAVW